MKSMGKYLGRKEDDSEEEDDSVLQTYCWGWGEHLQDEFRSETPVLATFFDVKQPKYVHAAWRHSAVVVRGGRLYMWGENSHGQLGLGHLRAVLSPQPVRQFSSVPVRMVATAWASTFALTLNGDVYSWGSNTHGQLGLGDREDRREPHILGAFRSPVACIAGGRRHALACTESGMVFAWGQNSDGQLGLGTLEDKWGPTEVDSLAEASITSVAAGYSHSLALGTTKSYSVLNPLNSPRPDTPPKPLSGLDILKQAKEEARLEAGLGAEEEEEEEEAEEAVAGGSRRGVRSALGRGRTFKRKLRNPVAVVMSWGNGERGQLGYGKFVSSKVPHRIEKLSGPGSTGRRRIVKICAGAEHSMALVDSGVSGSSSSVFAWGANNYGQLGNGGNYDEASPLVLGSLSGLDVVEIGAGFWTNFAICGEGGIYGWGWSRYGVPGHGYGEKNMKTLPTLIPSLCWTLKEKPTKAVLAGFGERHAFAVITSRGCRGGSFLTTWADDKKRKKMAPPKSRASRLCERMAPDMGLSSMGVEYICRTCGEVPVCRACVNACHPRHCVRISLVTSKGLCQCDEDSCKALGGGGDSEVF